MHRNNSNRIITDRKSVPIILLQDVWNLGKKGSVVTVRPGYMRNCLVTFNIDFNCVSTQPSLLYTMFLKIAKPWELI